MNFNSKQLHGYRRGRLLLVAVAVMAMMALVAVGSAGAANSSGGGGGKVVYAKKLTRVLPQGKEPVALEGGAFGPEGNFFFDNVLAKAGEPKIIKLDPKTKKSEGIHTDKTGIYTSTQFDAQGNLWVTDFGGKIDEMKPNGSDFKTTYSGKLATGADDLAFDKQGNMFVTDTEGSPWKPTGDLVGLNPQGKNPKVLMSGFAGTNGVSFTPNYERLWVSEYTGMREDLLTLNKNHTAVAEAQVGMHGSPGIGKFDSNMVDSAGNVYQCLNEDGEILVWNEHGELQETIKIKQDLGAPEMGATNLAIKPGTKTAYVVVGGQAGGFVYTFRTLAKGYAGSNGGSI
ncbi:MAG TPA: SMP-30/gluconolactonase/LRE family protein [Solirubrobacterales bacterium]|jgi:lactonase|nr:SMP-30/gluconolactonase/LRE family protein [Solirubrobacterales bacterium]